MGYTAADVKRLRDETDAPMMECKGALEEAGGDFDAAKDILREKGKAAAAKRVDRSTAAGVVAVSASEDGKTIAGVVLECETDFVARNEDFVALAQQIADLFLANDPGNDPMAVPGVRELVEGSVAKFRENTKITKALRETTGDAFASYVHHNRLIGVIIETAGTASNRVAIGYKVAIQSVAHPPQFVSKDQVPQDVLAKELEIETQRAMNEGKPENIAKNIAQGRINKEFLQQVVLLEQPFYADGSKKLSDYIAEEAKSGGGTMNVARFIRLAVGENA
jgi:elongation factor Ts